jgi:hypothetical protein
MAGIPGAVMSELAVALLLAALIAPPSAPAVSAAQAAAAAPAVSVSTTAAGASGVENAPREPLRRAKCADTARHDVKCPAPAIAPAAVK